MTPTNPSFTATTGGSDPASKTAAVSNTGSGNAQLHHLHRHRRLARRHPASGNAPATVTVSPHISGLAAGTYAGDVTITAAGATGSPKTVAVQLTVTDPVPPPPPSSADWLQVDHDAERTGYATGETALGRRPGPALAPAWTTGLDGKVTAQPLYAAA